MSVLTYSLKEEKRELTDKDIEDIKEQNNQMAQNALRVLAVAKKRLTVCQVKTVVFRKGLTFVGMLA